MVIRVNGIQASPAILIFLRIRMEEPICFSRATMTEVKTWFLSMVEVKWNEKGPYIAK